MRPIKFLADMKSVVARKPCDSGVIALSDGLICVELPKSCHPRNPSDTAQIELSPFLYYLTLWTSLFVINYFTPQLVFIHNADITLSD